MDQWRLSSKGLVVVLIVGTEGFWYILSKSDMSLTPEKLNSPPPLPRSKCPSADSLGCLLLYFSVRRTCFPSTRSPPFLSFNLLSPTSSLGLSKRFSEREREDKPCSQPREFILQRCLSQRKEK